MTNEATLTMRLPADLVRRVDALEERLQGSPEATVWRLSRSSVVRLALVAGLEALEAKYSAAPGESPGAKPKRRK
jgi:predicted transcriptional regulator